MIINFKKALCSGGGGGSSTTIEALNIIENGVYEAPKGTAYSPVTVDVPQPKVEAKKTVEITSNGNTEIVPSQGFDGIAGATVQVNVPTGGGTIDWSVLGYTDEEIGAIEVPFNRQGTIAEDIASSKAVWDRHPDGHFQGEAGLVYFPKMEITDTNLDSTFSGCPNLSYIPKNVFKNAEYVYSLFNNKNITKSYDFEWENIKVFNGVYNTCPNLREIYIGPLFNTENPISSLEIGGCTKLEKLIIEDGNYDIDSNISVIEPSLKYFECKVKNADSFPQFWGDNIETYISYNAKSFTFFDQLPSNCPNLKKIELKGCTNLVDTSFSLPYGFKTNNKKLRELAIEDTSNITELPLWGIDLEGLSGLVEIGAIDCTNVTSISHRFFGDRENSSLRYFKGFKNVKVDFDIRILSNLNKNSYLSIIDNLYDFKGTESHTATFSIKANNNFTLPEEWIQKATDKGWSISYA